MAAEEAEAVVEEEEARQCPTPFLYPPKATSGRVQIAVPAPLVVTPPLLLKWGTGRMVAEAEVPHRSLMAALP